MIGYVDTLQGNLAIAFPLLVAALVMAIVRLRKWPRTYGEVRVWAEKSGLDPMKPELPYKRLRRLAALFTLWTVFFLVTSAVFFCLAFTAGSRKQQERENQREHMRPKMPVNTEISLPLSPLKKVQKVQPSSEPAISNQNAAGTSENPRAAAR